MCHALANVRYGPEADIALHLFLRLYGRRDQPVDAFSLPRQDTGSGEIVSCPNGSFGPLADILGALRDVRFTLGSRLSPRMRSEMVQNE